MTTNATRSKRTRIDGSKPGENRPARGSERHFSIDPPSMAEPALQEMLQDPILLRLMLSDGVEPTQLLHLLDTVRSARH